MIRLHQTFGAHTGRVVDLDRDVIRFGRLPDNEVAFDPHADLDASGRHAEIRREGGQWVLVDVGSRNGTLIAGRRVTRHVLTSGEEIEFGLGGPRVRVELGAPSPSLGGSRPGIATAAATPVGPPSAPPVSFPNPTPPPSPFAGESPPAPMQPPMQAPMQGSARPIPAAMTPMPAVHPGAIHPPSAPPTPPSEKRYGQRTVGMMIQSALEQAQRQQGGGRSTAFFREVATEAAQRSSRGLKIVVALLALLLLLTLGAVVSLFFYARWQEQELRDENVALQRELASLGDGESAERRRLEQRLESLNEQIAEQAEAEGARIAEANDQAVYIVLTQRGSQREVLCSAFAVRPNLLATNAHCVADIERAMGRRQDVSVVSNRGRGAAMRVEQMWRHPAYVADAPVPSPDVGLLRVDRTMAQQVRMATMAELSALRVGDDLFVYGFPAQIAGSGAPVAVLTTGVVGRVTAFDGTEVEAARRHLVSHSAFTDDGTEGSPIFDREGRVVAINAGNYRARTRVVDPTTRMARTLDTETAYAWGVRADLLLQLLAGLPQ
jgi:S1-C subfamily serine protease